MLKRAQGLIGAVTLTLGIAQHAWGNVQIVPPGNDVAGQSQLFGPRHGGSGLWASPHRDGHYVWI